jgi:hypothetical protein
MHCNAEMPLRAEHCPRCGQKSYANFDMLAESVHEDAAIRRGLRIEDALRWTLVVMVLFGAIFYAFNDVFDKPLKFDGSAVTAIPAGVVPPPEIPQIEKSYADPRPPATVSGRAQRVFGYRSDPIRESLMRDNEAYVTVEKSPRSVREAIDLGLKFLQRSQASDGSYPVQAYPTSWAGYDTNNYQWGKMGVTSLAVLAFLGDGETWLPDQSGKPRPYERTVRAAIKWMAQNQNPDGSFGLNVGDGINFMYSHGMATLAMCEAAGLSGDDFVRQSAQRGIDYIVAHQNECDGWNYYGNTCAQSLSGADASVSAWQVQALYAGREAGLNVPEETLKRAQDMFTKLFNEKDGRVAYSVKNDDKQLRPSMCGVGLMMRMMLGEPPSTPGFKAVAQNILKALPRTQVNWGEGWQPNNTNSNDPDRRLYDPYMMYFCTYGMFMFGGRDWKQWHDGMKKSILEMQSADGCWRCNDVNTLHAGMNYSTALSVMTLQVYYRIH